MLEKKREKFRKKKKFEESGIRTHAGFPTRNYGIKVTLT